MNCFAHSRSIVAIAGKDFAVIGADTRLSSGYTILSREQSKLFTVGKSCVLASTGCWCDITNMTGLLEIRKKSYLHEHGRQMSTNAMAHLVSIMMYNRRFFPYYTSTIIAGLTTSGEGRVYSYDPLGNCEESTHRAGGSASTLVQPMLDSEVGLKNRSDSASRDPITKEKAIKLVKDAFVSATERDIQTGDKVKISIITADGIEEQDFELRKD